MFTFIVVNLGALTCWLLKGARSSWESEASGQFDRDLKYYRNLIVGIIDFTLVLFVLYKVVR